MEKSFSYALPIADENELTEAKRLIYGAVHHLANARGASINPEQVVLQTTFRIINDGSAKKLQGILTLG